MPQDRLGNTLREGDLVTITCRVIGLVDAEGPANVDVMVIGEPTGTDQDPYRPLGMVHSEFCIRVTEVPQAIALADAVRGLTNSVSQIKV